MTTETTTPATATGHLTPYGCAKIVNDQLKLDGIKDAAGEQKKLPPQMFYTYIKKGYIPSQDKKVAIVDLQKWYQAYVEKQRNKVSAESKTEEVVVADNDGTVGEWTE